MSDLIFKTDGKETSRIPSRTIQELTIGTKCPETKLEVKKMTEVEKVKREIKVLEKKLALLEEIERHNAKSKMHLENEGEFGIVTYDGDVYYRLEYPTAIIWYNRKDRFANDMMLVLILDLETHRLLEDMWNNQVLTQKNTEPYCHDDPEYYDEVEWDEKDNPNLEKIIDKMVEERKSQKLLNMLKVQLDYDGMVCDDIVDIVEDWLPKEQSAEGSQNAFAIDATEGFNHCLNKIKGMLR
jgi:hypothetical protein